MKVCFRPYRRRDGSLMIYINNDRKVSIGISPESGLPAFSKRTNGQNRLLNAAREALAQHGLEFTGDVNTAHAISAQCGPYLFIGTDVAQIGGQDVGSDGGYIVREGRYLQAGIWYRVED